MTTPTTSSQLLRSRVTAVRRRLARLIDTLDHLADDGGGIIRRAEEAVLDPATQPTATGGSTPSWRPGDPVGGSVTERATTPVVVTANKILNELTAIERTLVALEIHVRYADELRLQALAEAPLTDEERAKLIRLNAVDGECSVCGRHCAGTRDDRIHQVTIADGERIPMCDADRAAWSRRPYTDPGQLETYTEFRARRRADAAR